jgi:tRNA1Val (adenine37-N6)-methyltransferase
MPNAYFQFKQFRIRQERCAMKVGTDGVLLGAWMPLSNAQHMLDIGTGTGLIALMAAQRHANLHITAIEIDRSSAEQAAENVQESPWKDRIKVIRTDFKDYRSDIRFDTIVSNPPFFPRSLTCPDASRSQARHDISLSYSDLLQGVDARLTVEGTFSVILPTDYLNEFINEAASHNLFPMKRCYVVTIPGRTSKRTLLAFGRQETV